MKWIKILVLVAGILFIKETEAQVFSVGDTSCNYHLINKTFVNPVTPPTKFIAIDSFPIDVDGDFVTDLTIKGYNMMGNSASASSDECIYILSNQNVESIVTVGSYSYSTIIKNLSFGTFLSPALNWGTLPPAFATNVQFSPAAIQIPIIYEYWYNNFYGNDAIGSQVNPFYIGFRKILTNDTINGWILMNSNFPGKVISYAFKHTADTQPLITPVFLNSPPIVCNGSIVSLTATPSNGIYFGDGVNGNTFSSRVNGNYTVYYNAYGPNGFGCSNSAMLNIMVNNCIFPNPNNGEFEIYGIQEKTVFISNELGQIIEEKELNSENNYSVKINDLQNGIYFVGRQKIVVIR